MKKAHLLLPLFGCMLLQACTVAYYSIDNKLTNPFPQHKQSSTVAYHVSVSGQPIYGTMTSEYSPERFENMRVKYCRSTQKVFDREGISALSTTNKGTADFFIDIKATPYSSALPQEFLTGLSFGLIPSWGTRYNEYTYTFENVGIKSAHNYYVNSKSFNHLVCFPVFWTMFLTLDESKPYEKSLLNYLINE